MKSKKAARVGLMGCLLLSVVAGLAVAPSGIALMQAESATREVATCTGDPCATALCGAGWASAHAYGSEYSEASAKTDTQTSSQRRSGGGGSQADAVGSGVSSAHAFAEKNWSTRSAESNKTCHNDVSAATADAPRIKTLTIGCGGSDDISTTESFNGRLFVGNDGGLVAFDTGRAEGLVLTGTILIFGAGSLQSAIPMDVSAMNPTNVFLSVDLVDGDTDRCAVRLA